MANRRRNSSASKLPQNDTCRSTAPDGSSGRHPVYHGIRLQDGKWVPEICEPKKNTKLYLGTYPTPEMAAAAYDVAALALKGTNAVLNFPDSKISNMLPECPTAEDILIAAARAAAARSPGYEYGGGSMTAGGTDTPPSGVVMDDEELFNMPNLLSDMAQGMLLSPPRIDYNPPENGSYYNSGGSGNLWDYSKYDS